MHWLLAAELTTKLLDGLVAVHRQGLVHRDVKLSNVMLLPDRRTPKIIGFDLARGNSSMDRWELGDMQVRWRLRSLLLARLHTNRISPYCVVISRDLATCR